MDQKDEIFDLGDKAKKNYYIIEDLPVTQDSIDKLQDQIVVLNKNLEFTKEKLKLSYSERENIRKSSQKDIEDVKEFGVKKFAIQMFDVIDTLELCLKNLPLKKPNKNEDLKIALIGIESTRKQFYKVMKDFKFEPFNVMINDKFDPNIHNPIYEIPLTNKQLPNTVGSVVKSGWKKGNLNIRPAHIGIFKKQ